MNSLRSGKDYDIKKKRLSNILCNFNSPQVATIYDSAGELCLHIKFEECMGLKETPMNFYFSSDEEAIKWEESIMKYWRKLDETMRFHSDDKTEEIFYIPGFEDERTKLRFCPMCGEELDYEGARFCSLCGSETEDADENAEKKIKLIAQKKTDIGKAFEWLEIGDYEMAIDCFDSILSSNIRMGEAYLGKTMATLKISNICDLEKYTTRLEEIPNFIQAIKYSKPSLSKRLSLYVKNDNESMPNVESQQNETKGEKITKEDGQAENSFFTESENEKVNGENSFGEKNKDQDLKDIENMWTELEEYFNGLLGVETIKCPYCGKNTYNQTLMCIHCGQPIVGEAISAADEIPPDTKHTVRLICPICSSEDVHVGAKTFTIKEKSKLKIRKNNSAEENTKNSVGRGMMMVMTGGLWSLVPKIPKYEEISTTKTENKTMAVCQKCGYSWKMD